MKLGPVQKASALNFYHHQKSICPVLQAKQKQELPSLLGDPMTAQADIILKNIILPSNDLPEYPPLEKPDEPRILGRPIRKLSLAYVQRLGSLMAMLSEKNMAKGLLGMEFVRH